MADEKKTGQNPDDLENLSPEELQERIQEEKKNAKRSLRFAFTALLAIIAVCIAWFASNSQVTSTGMQIAAQNEEPFRIASVGERLKDEQNYLKDETGKNILSEGNMETHTSYIDTATGQEVTTTRTYYTGGSGVAWHMNEQSLVPGAQGKLEFYLIPNKDGLSSADISLNLVGYSFNEKENKVQKIETPKIQSLLNGHILLFQHVDDDNGYSGWLGENQKFTMRADANGSTTFKKNMPYKITIFWKWPQYFRNYIYTQKSTYGDLFTDASPKGDGSDYQKLITFVNKQRDIKADTGKLFYDASANKADKINEEINNTMSDEILDACSTYYNQADEYIGTNTQYVYIQIDVN